MVRRVDEETPVPVLSGETTVAVDAQALGRVGKALADPTRRRLLLSLVRGPAFPSDLADGLGLTRANVSNHLTCLRGCGLVSTVPVGRRVRYELADPRLAGALAQLASLVLVVSDGATPGEPCGPGDYPCSEEPDSVEVSDGLNSRDLSGATLLKTSGAATGVCGG